MTFITEYVDRKIMSLMHTLCVIMIGIEKK